MVNKQEFDKKYIYEKDGVISIEITPLNIQEAVAYIKLEKIKSIFFENSFKNEFQNFNFLSELDVSELSVINDSVDFEKFPVQNNIKKIFITNFKGKVLLSKFPLLQEATLDWNNKIYFNNFSLSKLVLWKFNSKSKSLQELLGLENLRELQINQTSITSCLGVEKLEKLESIEIFYATKLKSISDISNLKKLNFLLIDTAKKIEDHTSIKSCGSIETLAFNSCGCIESLDFIKHMTYLKEFRFVDTTIVDGNLSPCLKLLKVSFNDKRHYSHKLKEMKGLLA